MNRYLLLPLLLLCAYAPAQIPQSAAKEGDGAAGVFRVDVNLVQVDAVVTDKNGRPVTDLTAGDFIILQDGKPQEITNFSLVRLPAPLLSGPAVKKPPSKFRDASPQAPTPQVRMTPEEVRRVVALVVDDLGLSFSNTVQVRDAVRKWVDEEMQPGDLVAVVTTGFGMGGLQQFTGDKKLLYEAIDRIRFNILSRVGASSYEQEETALSTQQEEERSRGMTMGTLGSLRYILNGMEILPGRKSLILFSENLVMNFDDSEEGDEGAVFKMNLSDSSKDRMQLLVQDANRASVVIHTIDPRGTTWGAHPDVETSEMTKSREGLTVMAQQTGGLFIGDHNFVEPSLQEAARDGETYYLIGFLPGADTVAEIKEGRSKYHNLTVRVKRPGLQVRSRSGFFSTTEEAPYAPAPDSDTLARAMLSPLLQDDLPVRLASGYVLGPEGDYLLRVWVHLPGRQLAVIREGNGEHYVSLETYAATTGFDGLIHDSGRTTHKIPLNTQEILSIREHGLRFSVAIPAKNPGTYFVRLAVKDLGSGRIGSAYQYVEIPDLRKEGLALSDLFVINSNEDVRLILPDAGGKSSEQAYSTGQNREKSPAIRQYQPGETLEFLAVVYNAVALQGSPPDLETRTVLYRDGGEIFRSDPEPVDPGKAFDSARIPVKKRMRLGKTMPPGDYILQLQVIDKRAKKQKNLASASLDFQVIPEKEPGNLEKAEALIRRGNEANRAGRKEVAAQAFAEAARLYRQEIGNHPDDTVLWKQAGTVHFLAGQTEEAAAAYEEAVRLQPEDAESHYMLGIIRAATDVDSGIGSLREAIRLDSDNAKYRFDLGRALAQNQDFQSSIEALREASRLDPRDGESHASMGIVLEQMGEMEEAVGEYRQALALDLSDNSADSVRELLKKALADFGDGDAEKRRESITLRAKDWRSAVERHVPGKSDTAAVEVGSWPVNDLDIIISLLDNIREGELDPIVESSLVRPFKGRQYIEESILPLLNLTDSNNRLLKRAALLHTDIAMFQLDTGPLDSKTVIYRGIVYKKGRQAAVSIQDGRGTGLKKVWHWEFARHLLGRIAPRPSDDDMVRKWYVAATAFMLSRRQFDEAEDNLAAALEHFPSHPGLLFYRGVLHEKYATTPFQDALPPEGGTFVFGSEKSELQRAEGYFQKALEIDPAFCEARLHLGRVQGLLGDHETAVDELQQAAASIKDRQLRYYCALYLGNELAALNRTAEARKQYETAAKLYPGVQSPLLGLSQLALKSGDYENAMAFGKQVLTLPAGEDASDDPWWSYDVSAVLNAPALISEMYEAAAIPSP
ncbi:MAG: VWA domain-containing protein [Acidobacteria bacterium]|nr:VWA domain-containing protein [Acidobacteriota bacterium]